MEAYWSAQAKGSLETYSAAKRIKQTIATMCPIRHIPGTQEDKAYLLGATATKQAVYGYELCEPSQVSISSFREAVKGTIWQGNAKWVCPEAARALVFKGHEIDICMEVTLKYSAQPDVKRENTPT